MPGWDNAHLAKLMISGA